METSTIEGTWEEIQQYGARLAGHRIRVTVLDEKTNGNEKSKEPNRKMSEVLRKIADEQENMRFTDSSKTQEILRKGRYGECSVNDSDLI